MHEPTVTASRPRRWRRTLGAAATAVVLVAGYAGTQVAASPTADHQHGSGQSIGTADRVAAMRATAAYQDVAAAEAAGYGSSLDTLGCFQNPGTGGMGLHYIDAGLLDDTVDITAPEALVYELDASGQIAGLVAHEYIVPIDAWASNAPPRLFGRSFHQHPTLPLWVLHAWLWKDNPAGDFEDWNPAVRLCPAGVPVFGADLPSPQG
jgi:hypothetical protein